MFVEQLNLSLFFQNFDFQFGTIFSLKILLDKISSSEDESDSDLDHEISRKMMSFFKVCRKKI